ncbi:Stp1/IreP family PP2C-type Ser/Thr phosphatase [Thermohalobacter berrensis]|uniref:protein-serine/threonine phosphatase n=1 Tax=Thermohalobacter berrensis TaxID=99594 RepID=A0A419TA71_9FIRM|nr:Stp1/IreP family PP2C-type Ser/Thr phosphatase [Thermohalobacter berrensis]RKD34366.1 serine/threonine protein phosphatase [Thermohalobacter berrensis]
MQVGVCTDVGEIRKINQDSFFYSDLDQFPLFVVADGMGGHNAGEVASRRAVEIVKKIFYDNKEKLLNNDIEVSEFIKNTLKKANLIVYEEAQKKEECYGMGTTVTMAYIYDNRLFIGHIGDSRAYLFRNNELIQLTQDHSLVAELVRKGSITKEEAINHPQKNIITRALGTEEDIEIDIISKDLIENDIILLCTDGLTNMVSEERIKEILLLNKNLQDACDELTKTANDLGGFDNTTVMLIGIE